MTSRTHQIYNIIFEHAFEPPPPPPVWTMLKKTALFLRDGFPKEGLILCRLVEKQRRTRDHYCSYCLMLPLASAGKIWIIHLLQVLNIFWELAHNLHVYESLYFSNFDCVSNLSILLLAQGESVIIFTCYEQPTKEWANSKYNGR